jgi:EH domain-containing protein 1
LEKKLLDRVDKMLAEEVPKLMSMIPQEEHAYLQLQAQSGNATTSPSNTVFNDQEATPFELGGVEGINEGLGETDWIVTRSRHEYDQVFTQLSPQNGKISGASAKQEMVKSKLVSFSISKLFISINIIVDSRIMFLVVYGS